MTEETGKFRSTEEAAAARFALLRPQTEADVELAAAMMVHGVLSDLVRGGRPRGPSSMLSPTPQEEAAQARRRPAQPTERAIGPRPASELRLIDALAAKFVGGPNEPLK